MQKTSKNYFEDIRQCNIFSGLTDEEILMIRDSAEEYSLMKNEVFINEGDCSHNIFIIKSGRVEVFKKSCDGQTHNIVVLNSGECVGEMSLIELDSCRSASARAIEKSELIKIDFDKVIWDNNFKPIHFKVAAGIAAELSKRLRYTNDVTVKAMKKEIDSDKARLAMGVFAVNIMFIIAVYTLALRSLSDMVLSIGNSTPITIGIACFFAVFIYILIKKSGYPMSTFGLTMKNLKQVFVESIQYSLPVILLLVIVKAILINFVPSFKDESLFDFMDVLSRMDESDIKAYILSILLYSVFVPLQEFIARSGIQAAFQNFLPESRTKIWTSIVMSNLLFSMAHSHISFLFAVLAFIPGLFWGWMFNRQKSLLGVSVSHILIGDIALYLLGFRL